VARTGLARRRYAIIPRYAQRDAELAEREEIYFSPFLYRLLLKTGGLGS